jgi:hypothetical protein
MSSNKRACYTRNGTTIEDIAYQPCNSDSSRDSVCCGTNHQGAGHVQVANDACDPNGLCQNFEAYDGTNQGVKNWWRQGCTDPTWQSESCLKNVCNFAKVSYCLQHGMMGRGIEADDDGVVGCRQRASTEMRRQQLVLRREKLLQYYFEFVSVGGNRGPDCGFVNYGPDDYERGAIHVIDAIKWGLILTYGERVTSCEPGRRSAQLGAQCRSKSGDRKWCGNCSDIARGHCLHGYETKETKAGVGK